MTEEDKIIAETEQFVHSLTEGESSGHDWWHIVRVRQLAVSLAQKEGANLFICQLAALLHDVADKKFNPSLEAGLQRVASWLEAHPLATTDREHILDIIANMSFTSQKNGKQVTSLEGQIVQDADRLDALGAIGIARVMAYSGYAGRLIASPDGNEATAIRHFYDKLLSLEGLMNTSHARQLAAQRTAFMKTYLNQFYAEWPEANQSQAGDEASRHCH